MKRTPFFLLGAALVAIALVGCDSTVSTAKDLKVTITYTEHVEGGNRHLSPGVWVLVGSGQRNPFFTQDSYKNKAMGLEALAETGMNEELAGYLVNSGMVAGKFGPATADTGMTSFELSARPGDKLYFATMVAPTNDWLAAPAAGGVDLFGEDNKVNSSGHTIYVWDAGFEEEDPATEVAKDGDNSDDPMDDDMTVRIVMADQAMFSVTVTVEEM